MCNVIFCARLSYREIYFYKLFIGSMKNCTESLKRQPLPSGFQGNKPRSLQLIAKKSDVSFAKVGNNIAISSTGIITRQSN